MSRAQEPGVHGAAPPVLQPAHTPDRPFSSAIYSFMWITSNGNGHIKEKNNKGFQICGNESSDLFPELLVHPGEVKGWCQTSNWPPAHDRSLRTARSIATRRLKT